MKILLTGSRGFVGSYIKSAYSDMIVETPSLRDASEDDIRRIVGESDADVIINTAAISEIPVCEKDPEASYRANVLLPLSLAHAADGRKLILFSSDQVYGASPLDGPYTEADTAPGNTYARHKVEMEERVLDTLPSAVMLRAEWMYGYGYGRNNYINSLFLSPTLPEYSSREFRGVTYIKEVVESIPRVAELPGGVYNYGSETTLSIYDVTKEVLRQAGHDTSLLKDGRGKHNLWMDTSKARRFGVTFSSALDGALRCMKDHNLG